MFSSRSYQLGRVISLFAGSILFLVATIVLPIVDINFREVSTIIIGLLISISMALGGLFFLYIYKDEVKNERALYEENERLKKVIKESKNIPEQDFRFDELDKE